MKYANLGIQLQAVKNPVWKGSSWSVSSKMSDITFWSARAWARTCLSSWRVSNWLWTSSNCEKYKDNNSCPLKKWHTTALLALFFFCTHTCSKWKRQCPADSTHSKKKIHLWLWWKKVFTSTYNVIIKNIPCFTLVSCRQLRAPNFHRTRDAAHSNII